MPKKFSSPPNKQAFMAMVWEVVRDIPAGQVSTYGRIAELMPPPEGMTPISFRAWGPRWVGGAMANCPDTVPWHRVINSQGKISLRKGGGHLKQRQLLEAEGIVFDEKDRVDLKRFGWKGMSKEWLEEHGLL